MATFAQDRPITLVESVPGNRNVFGATAFSTYGGFWMSVGIFVAFAIFNTYMLFWSARVSTAVFGVFLTLEITEILLAIGNFMEAHGHANSTWVHAGGWAGIVTAGVAWYASAAGVINGMSGRIVLPVGALRIGRIHSPMPRRAEAH
jgi:succinate-acetate transporter protein